MAMCSKGRCGRASSADFASSAIASRWSCRQRRKKRGRGRTSRQRVASSSPCFIIASLGIHYAALAPPRRCPCSIWVPEHGTTRPCRNSTPRRRLRRPRHHRTHASKRRPKCTSKRRIWRLPGEEAAAGCWCRSSSPAGDAVGAWVPGVIYPGHRSGTKGWLTLSRVSFSCNSFNENLDFFPRSAYVL